MNKFDYEEELSEDWISQPRSSATQSAMGGSILTNSSTASQCRIPRPASRPSSIPKIPGIKPAGGAHTKPVEDNRLLAERTASDLNVLDKRPPRGSAGVGRKPQTGIRTQQGPRGSIESTIQGTVQLKAPRASGLSGAGLQSTPDWKRRILNGKGDLVGQQDLFSPMKLEHVFKPPAARGQPPQQLPPRKGKMYEPSGTDCFPSSPPPYPSAQKSARSTEQTWQLLGNDRLLQTGASEELRNSPGGSRNSRPGELDIQEGEERPPVTAYKVDEKGREASAARPPAGRRIQSEGSAIQHEIISPVPIADGRIDYKTLHTLSNRREMGVQRPRTKDIERPSSSASDSKLDNRNSLPVVDGQLPRRRSLEYTTRSFPDDMTTGTEAFASNGGFITTKRGGYSSENSFRRRTLSSSSFRPSDALIQSSTLDIIHNGSTLPDYDQLQSKSPTTPARNAQNRGGSSENPKSSGSPLKLFDKYDTFTNDRLFRRMSQFERSYHSSRSASALDDDHGSSPSPGKERHRKSRLPYIPGKEQESRLSSFGDGMLDTYGFTHRQSARMDTQSSLNDEDQENQPPLPELNRWETSFDDQKRARAGSSGRKGSLPVSKVRSGCADENQPRREREDSIFDSAHWSEGDHVALSKEAQAIDGKRVLVSPTKDRSPKRRRTIYGNGVVLTADDVIKTASTQSIAGRKRKDARYDNHAQIADPSVIATRHMLQPRTQHPSLGRGTSQFQHSHPLVDTPTEILAGELAHFALDVAQDLTNGVRKTSVVTADYLEEAALLMRHLRATACPPSRHSSGEQSQLEPLSGIEESMTQESTKEDFSRPPSREGGNASIRKPPMRVDPRVISHLRHYEEKDDLSLALTPRSLRHDDERHDFGYAGTPESLRIMPHDAELKAELTVSDPPNIRIREGSRSRQIFRESGGGIAEDTGSKSLSQRSHPSSSASTGLSVPTGSSGGSKSKAVIAPEKVSHLISDHVGGMTFDHSRKMWVKRRMSKGASETLDSDGTEDDPFREIPDLLVDEREEMQQVRYTSTALPANATAPTQPRKPAAEPITSKIGYRPDSSSSTMSKISKFSKLASSGPLPDTRATSWGDNVQLPKEDPIPPVLGQAEPSEAEEAEHEIGILEGRSSRTPLRPGNKSRQPRVVTVAFSSPLVHATQDLHEDEGVDANRIWEDDSDGSDLDLSDSPDRHDIGQHRTGARMGSGDLRSRTMYGSRRRISIGSRNYLARSVSRIDENDEFSFMNHRHKTNASGEIAISTPRPLRDMPGTLSMPPPSTSKNSSVMFHLSPLPDFTLHQADESLNLDVGYMTERRGLLSIQEVEGRFSLAIKDLVNRITDVEPYEPYWEYIRKLELRNKDLLTLHMLDEFCPRIEELDVSNNELGQLNGAPESLRILDARHNCFSSLTAWGHLRNLQYIDVSNNQIQSLKAFQGLVHLREVRADENQIENLEDVLAMNGLLKLRLRGNRVKHANFQCSDMLRLLELDLQGNEISLVSNLQHLPALTHLNLRGNRLQGIHFDSEVSSVPLSILDVAQNEITTLDITNLRHLRSLNVDKNHLKKIRGIHDVLTLENLSWREQTPQEDDAAFTIAYNDCTELQTLALSGNKLHSFTPTSPFLNLQRLELASVGLDSLSADFGPNMPNLRFLNLNHNALKDLRPLLGTRKLEALHVAGNRIARLRRTAAVLSKLGPSLHTVDCRHNPLTLGFHAPAGIGDGGGGSRGQAGNGETRLVVQGKHPSASDHSARAEDASDVAAAAYLLPAGDEGADGVHRRRANADTAMRRRVYELLVVSDCDGLRRLDGLPVDGEAVGAADGTMDRLVELGVLRGRRGG